MRGFQAPPEFVPSPRAAPPGTRETAARLWLIRAPADFTARGFSGKKIPLVGFQTLQSKTCEDKVYNVFSTPGGAEGICLILPTDAEGRTESCSDFAGCITIDENWEAACSSAEPRCIPTSPAPNIPTDLKQRFQPFGVGPPGWSTRERQPTRRGKKKRAKEKVAVEELEPGGQEVDSETPGESRKKKKKKSKELLDVPVPEVGHKHRKREKRGKDESYENMPSESDTRHKKKKKKDKV
ncbi:CD3e molecule, epsilon associated protein [Leucoraja erinacea]|uniref:CD3e molecule, epsilon associated protein n=1 Tax=Leucoraja erinaceus TaxID=7782 RepID=UPI002454285B|nr:CD3e molecule, epsilon associated protein [Leucoraja erinacea]